MIVPYHLRMKTLIVILTHDRPKNLYRCINTTIQNNKIASTAHWLIVDDSNKTCTKENSEILHKFASDGLVIFHITDEIRKNISSLLYNEDKDNQYDLIFKKSNKRDISGLRNIGLLSSLILDAGMTFFIDDDVVPSNINGNSFLDYVFSHYQYDHNYIVGAKLMGILDESYIGRIKYLLKLGKTALLHQNENIRDSRSMWIFKKNPLWVNLDSTSENLTTHTSGGLIAFNLDSKSIMPFSSGYNEDWIWCLMQHLLNGTKVISEKMQAVHSPPFIFQPNIDEILWESLGEIMFESLLATTRSKNVSSITKLWKLSKKYNNSKQWLNGITTIIKSLNAIIKNEKKSHDMQYLRLYLSQLKKIYRSIEVTDIDKMIDDWFENFNKRKMFFSSILNRKVMCSRINDVLKEAMVH